jgi:site-specific DNA-methyltransferase (adenine-specific)
MKYMATCLDNQFDLAIVDPPYGIMDEKKSSGFMRPMNNKKASTWDKRPDSKYFKELKRVSNNQIIWGMQYFISDLDDCSSVLIWDKVTGSSYFADAELAYCSIKGTARIFKHQWCGAFKESERTISPIQACQKPIMLYKWLLKNYAKEGDKILDTHLGSGSIAIACHDMGFDLEGCEIDKDYFDNTSKRLKNHTDQNTFF